MNGKLGLFKNVSLFANLTERDLQTIAQYSDYYAYKKGDVIFKEGDYADGLYIIAKGEVLITKRRDNVTINVADFIKGESFGELDLLENKPMNASATAESDCSLLIFPTKDMGFENVLSKQPEISAHILHELLAIIANRIRNTNNLISKKSKWITELKGQLYRDKLTGLFNRTYFEEELIANIQKLGEKVSLVMVKPDKFKMINDNYGHEGGDRALQIISNCLESQLRENDIAVRYRGDEFAVILPSSDFNIALNYANDIKQFIKELNLDIVTGGEPLSITASIGTATYPVHAKTGMDLIKICFDKMFMAWESGGDRVISL